MSHFVHSRSGEFLGRITKQSHLAPGFVKGEPWLLLYKAGRIERFPVQNEAKAEARKQWGNCRFSRISR